MLLLLQTKDKSKDPKKYSDQAGTRVNECKLCCGWAPKATITLRVSLGWGTCCTADHKTWGDPSASPNLQLIPHKHLYFYRAASINSTLCSLTWEYKTQRYSYSCLTSSLSNVQSLHLPGSSVPFPLFPVIEHFTESGHWPGNDFLYSSLLQAHELHCSTPASPGGLLCTLNPSTPAQSCSYPSNRDQTST